MNSSLEKRAIPVLTLSRNIVNIYQVRQQECLTKTITQVRLLIKILI
jgi:hypothetical protein